MTISYWSCSTVFEKCVARKAAYWWWFSFLKMPLTKKAFGLLLADLSEVFDCHDLLIAKLYAYELDLSSMNLALSYLSKRKQITKVDPFFSSWEDILSGIPQTLSCFLFCSIFLCVTIIPVIWGQSTLLCRWYNTIFRRGW